MGFRPANPSDAVDRGPWWQIYGDPALDGLAAQVDISNQTLKAAEAAYRQARALVRQDQSGLYPSITASASAQQTGSGNNRGGGTTIITTNRIKLDPNTIVSVMTPASGIIVRSNLVLRTIEWRN